MSLKNSPKRVILPSVFTALNIFCGFLSILESTKAESSLTVVAPGFAVAAWLMIIAAIFDTMDGKIARMTKTYSDFGVEFDSLADIVSFGVAPSVLLYQLYFFSFGTFGVVLSFFPLLFGGIRLARFNVQLTGFEKNGFSGLPIPSSAAGIGTFVLLSTNEFLPFATPYKTLFEPFLVPLVILLSLLMVSTFSYATLPHFSLRKGMGNIFKLFFLITSFFLIVFFPKLVFFPLVMCYVFSGVINRIACIFKTSVSKEGVTQEAK
jgi:CDP-diacylglycerol--serine O-phosphatidyltransferase